MYLCFYYCLFSRTYAFSVMYIYWCTISAIWRLVSLFFFALLYSMVLTTICCLLLFINPLIDIQYFEHKWQQEFPKRKSEYWNNDRHLVVSVCPVRLWIDWPGEIQIETNANFVCQLFYGGAHACMGPFAQLTIVGG